MYLLKNNILDEYIITYDLGGYPVEDWTIVREGFVDSDVQGKRWSEALQDFEVIPSGDLRQVIQSLDADPRWLQLKAATPAQINAFIDGSVTDLASAKEILKMFAKVLRLLVIRTDLLATKKR